MINQFVMVGLYVSALAPPYSVIKGGEPVNIIGERESITDRIEQLREL